MNNRALEKYKDIRGMSKAVSELLAQAWERGRKYGYATGYEDGMNHGDAERLAGLEAHADTYESCGYSFGYHEQAGIYTISIFKETNGTIEPMEHYTCALPLSHATFVEWCETWIQNNRED